MLALGQADLCPAGADAVEMASPCAERQQIRRPLDAVDQRLTQPAAAPR